MLSKIQKEIVSTNEEKVVVLSSAASGKTTVITERVKELLRRGVRTDKIVVITFTNCAAEEMKKRIGNSEAFIGTIHSYANHLLVDKGFNTSGYLESDNFDKLFELVKDNQEVIPQVDYLILDEAQDSTELQFEFLLDLIKPKSYFLVGDFRQSIYGFNGARPDILMDLSKDYGVKTYDLNENYRNDYKILNFARTLIRNLGSDFEDHSRSMTGGSGEVIMETYSPQLVLDYIKSEGNPKDWFVLTRSNAQLEEIYYYLTGKGIPCDTFKRSEISVENFKKKMEENTVKVLTIHAAKGLEANNVIVIGAKNWNREEVCVQYVAATRAKNLLVWTTTPKKKKKTYMNWD